MELKAKQGLDRSLPPDAAPMEKVLFPNVREARLRNGIPVYMVQFGTQEITELMALFPAGRSFEPAPAIASFTSKMLLEGTKSYSSLEFARKMNEYGAFIHPESGFESANWELSSLTKHLDNTVPLLAELLLEPRFPASELANLKERTLQNLEVEEQKTGFIARKEFNRLLHGNDHPYGRPTEREDVSALEIPELQSFHGKHFSLSNCTFIACGRFDEDKLLATLEKHFGAAFSAPVIDTAQSQAQVEPAAHPTGLHYFEMPDSMQATVRVGHKGLKRNHPDYFPLQVLTTVLGGYFGSRLMKNIREDKGYTYGIGSAWLSMKYGGTFLIQTDVGNEYIKPTLEEIKKEMKRLIEDGLPEEEVRLVKNYMLGRSASARETPSQIAGQIKSYLVNELPFSLFDDKFDIVQSVTAEDLHQLAIKYLHPDQLLEVVAGKMP